MTIWDYIVSQQENREKASDWEYWKTYYAKELGNGKPQSAKKGETNVG